MVVGVFDFGCCFPYIGNAIHISFDLEKQIILYVVVIDTLACILMEAIK
jgi:hypothetical protein